MIKFMRFKWLYFLISAVVIIPGIFSMIFWGFKPSIDFTGGTVLELKFNNKIQPDKYGEIQKIVEEKAFSLNSIQSSGENNLILRLKPISKDDVSTIKTALAEKFEEMPEEVRFETVGPLLGRELIIKTIIAIILAALFILGFVAWAFKKAQFGVCAIIAMFHDSLVLLGSFSLLGHFLGVEIDTLFVTAVLTTLSFSVHDTVVVYDRIRESQKKFSNANLEDLVDKAINETLPRSLNNSLTIIFMLIALILLGGVTMKWFIVALLIGTISGTYSSTFNAAPLLVVWDLLRKKLKK